jgi:hypothetical protein
MLLPKGRSLGISLSSCGWSLSLLYDDDEDSALGRSGACSPDGFHREVVCFDDGTQNGWTKTAA